MYFLDITRRCRTLYREAGCFSGFFGQGMSVTLSLAARDIFRLSNSGSDIGSSGRALDYLTKGPWFLSRFIKLCVNIMWAFCLCILFKNRWKLTRRVDK